MQSTRCRNLGQSTALTRWISEGRRQGFRVTITSPWRIPVVVGAASVLSRSGIVASFKFDVSIFPDICMKHSPFVELN